MIAVIRRGWLWVKKNRLWILLVLVVLVVIVLLSAYADAFPHWTGLPEYDAGGGRLERPKTLWDWLDLLIVGAVLAAGGFLLNRSARKSELQIAEENRNQATLQAYYDRMADLILTHKFKDKDEGQEGRSIARARTLATLRALDAERKGSLVRFLYESELIGYIDEEEERQEPIILLSSADLRGADLRSARLRGVNLSAVDLRGAILQWAILASANLSGADLRNADLYWPDLTKAFLDYADLRKANLSKAVMRGASLANADLRGADLKGADLAGADLLSANLREANLQEVELNKAFYNHRTIWPDGFDPEAAGAVLVEST